MAAQKEAIEEGRFALREVEIVDDFRGNELWQGRHTEKCSLPKRIPASSSTLGLLPPLMQLPVPKGQTPGIATGSTTGPTGGGCQWHLTAVGCLKTWHGYTTRRR